MPLGPGARLGPYEILSALGAGGMGEVYRARDAKLNRDVALKVIPDTFALDPDRLARFKREAQLLASLNHPNIAAIYGFEDSGSTHALVLELVDGETLADRIVHGPVPLDETLPIARQICEALEAAHEHGIIHRDLKPANIKVRSDGTVKVLDFGLAKALDDPSPTSSLSISPTITSPAMMTGAGVLLGTAAYMSPEQARGKVVDKRVDIWAFGCVLYEMLTATSAFAGDGIHDVIIATMTKEPDWTLLPAATRPRISELLRRCLKKDPRDRLRDIGDARLELQGGALDATQGLTPPTPLRSKSAGVLVGLAAVLAVFAMTFAVLYFRRPSSSPPAAATLQLLPPEKSTFGSIAISPDGQRIAFTAGEGASGASRLWVRPLDSLAAKELPNTAGASYPFWSPDGRFIGFFADHKLKKIEASGGPAQTICDLVNDRGGPLGGTWSRSGLIIFAVEPFGPEPLYQVSAAGGQAIPLPMREPSAARNHHHWPSFLPDGRHFLYFAANTNREGTGVYLASLDSTDVRLLVNADTSGMYAPAVSGASAATGYVLFARERTLMVQPLDSKFEPKGDATPIAEQVGIETVWQHAKISVSENGVLVYGTGSDIAQLVWFDRSGKRQGAVGPPGVNISFRIAPEGDRVAAQQQDGRGGAYIWLFDLARSTSARLALRSAYNLGPVWSPDGSRLAFGSVRDRWEIRETTSDGGSGESLLLNTHNDLAPLDWSSDGKHLLYVEIDANTRHSDVGAVQMGAIGEASRPTLVVRTEFDENFARFSPDGRWVAYVSNESGRDEIYVRPFHPDGASGSAKWQISTDGGTEPRWTRASREIFYVGPDDMLMAVDVKTGATVEPGVPRTLFSTRPAGVERYDVTPDGQRFLVSTPTEETASAPATVVLNWPALLKK